jgi:hypothetical protein
MDILVILIGSSASLLGVLMTMIFNAINNANNRKLEERKHTKQLIIEAAIEIYKQQAEIALKKNAMPIAPDIFLFQMMKFHEMILEKDIKPENLEAAFTEYEKIMRKLIYHKYGDIWDGLDKPKKK